MPGVCMHGCSGLFASWALFCAPVPFNVLHGYGRSIDEVKREVEILSNFAQVGSRAGLRQNTHLQMRGGFHVGLA